MSFSAMYLVWTVVLLVAWRGRRRLAVGLFGIAVVLTTALFVHHVTDSLKLSF